MKNKLKPMQTGRRCAALLVLVALPAVLVLTAQAKEAPSLAQGTAPKAAAPIPLSEIGAKAGADYKGNDLSVMAAANGARLRCVFQRLEGEATTEGLWLVSTVTNAASERFRVTACSVGRGAGQPSAGLPRAGQERLAKAAGKPVLLPLTGTVEVADKLARFVRTGLTEEYSVSMDGVRQDFVVTQRPAGTGGLQVQLAVTGARVEPADSGAWLVLNGSGRKIAYSRLRVTDATGRELSARMEVRSVGDEVTSLKPNAESRKQKAEMHQSFPTSTLRSAVHPPQCCYGGRATEDGSAPTGARLAVQVNDAEAVYPVRIDPTFSDANWISMEGIPGTDGEVYAAVVDGSGNLYIGGAFTIVGDLFATNIAKWNGSSWSALGLGMNDFVSALAVSGSDVFAGGAFTTAGGSAAKYIAKWNGNTWSALGSGMNNSVGALAVSGSDLYAGGYFTTAGGVGANCIAKWNGSGWTPLGSGIGGGDSCNVSSLAVSGSDVYAGGEFTTAGGNAANHIAKWNGSSWSALGSGVNGIVYALTVSGSDVYAGGQFTTAGGTSASYIANWNGSNWSALGSGMNDSVWALAVSGSDVYAGGVFTTSRSGAANYIAKWNGSTWTALAHYTASVTVDGTNKSVIIPATNSAQFFRLRKP